MICRWIILCYTAHKVRLLIYNITKLFSFVTKKNLSPVSEIKKMEILRENFAEELPNILKSINEADFISFDYEFTGLFTDKEVGMIDTQAERYDRHRKQCVRFLPIQAGICTFKYNHADRKYVYRPYSIYLFPHSSDALRMSPRVFLLDGSSIDFLVKHNFDFNKAFYHGVGFGTLQELETRRQDIEKRYKGYVDDLKRPSEPSVVLPNDKIEFMEEKVAKVREFLDTSSDEDEELVFGDLSAWERKLLFTFLPLKVNDDPHSFTVESRYNSTDGPTIVIKRNEEGVEGKVQAILRRQQEQIANLEVVMGFSKIVQALSKADAILIGHNQGIDLMQTLHHCISPLPESYSQYKEFVTSTFPRLIDTKYLCQLKFSDIVSNSGLGSLYESVRLHPFKKLEVEPEDEEFDMLSDSNKFHDAGFDAFITGHSLISMLEYLADKKKLDHPVENAENILKKYYHRIPMMNAIGVTHMNLGGPDSAISRENVFYTTFPQEWRASDIQAALKPVAEAVKINIHWLNDTSAWICVREDVKIEEVEKLSKSQCGFRVVSFARYMSESQSDCEPSAKRLRVSNGSKVTSSGNSGDGQTPAPPVFEVPKDW